MSDDADHEWYDFDVLRGLEVKRERVADGYVWKVRDARRIVYVLTDEEFEQLRSGGNLPDVVL